MELRDYLRVVSHRKWIILQSIVVVAAVALVASLLQRPVYEGETHLLILQRSAGPNIFGDVLSDWTFQPERRLQTQAELVRIRPIAETVIRQLNLRETPETLLRRVKVEPAGQTDLIQIKVTDSDPRKAADIANAVAGAYVAWSRASNQAAIKAARETVAAKLEEAREELFGVAKEITKRRSEGKTVPEELQAQLRVGTGLFVTLSEKLEQLTINENLERGLGQVVAPAVLPERPIRPKPLLNTLLGLLVGAVLGVGGAFLAEYLDNTVKTVEEAQRHYGVPVLARLPADSGPDKAAYEIVLESRPNSAAAEAYRSLRTALEYLNFDGSVRRILVTSAAPQEGKSTTIANLAVAIAQTGKRVLVIEGDFRRPTADRFFRVASEVGLSDVLTGQASLKAAIQTCGVPNLGVLPSGPLPPNPSELLGSATMRSVLDHAAQVADFVLVDSPPVLAVTDCAVLAPLVDGILLVAQAGTSTREGAERAVQVLRGAETRLLGLVLNNVPTTDTYGYRYYEYYNKIRGRSGAGAGSEDEALSVARARGPVMRMLGRWAGRVLAIAAAVALGAAALVGLDALAGLGLVRGLLKALGIGG